MTEQLSSRFELRHAATDRPSLVRVGPRRFLAIDGIGRAESVGYRLASETLRQASRQLGVRVAHRLGSTYRPTMLETIWRHQPVPEIDHLAVAFADRSDWEWEQLAEIPEQALPTETDEVIAETRAAAGRLERLLRVVTVAEGFAVQILHLGDTRAATATLALLCDFCLSNRLAPLGPIHELRLADESDVPRGRARAILRLPIVGP